MPPVTKSSRAPPGRSSANTTRWTERHLYAGHPQPVNGYDRTFAEYLDARPIHKSADALAYLALTASDLWPGRDWNFVFGEASLRQRLGVWPIYRNGDPETDFRLCLRRALSTAPHETGHILGIWHCTAYLCLMNGSNHQQEKGRRPMHLCPVCLHKLCWNLQVEPVPYLTRLKAFCEQNGLEPERNWYERAIAALAT